ncbi:MAG: TonB-dependent receptor [Pseudomonadales bacterium]
MTVFKKSKIHIACRAALMAVAAGAMSPHIALAQGTSSEDGAALEEIVVTGYKASIIAGRDAKRANEGITDSIFSEDIGKSTDSNIAEALRRVTGISIQSVDGVGSTVTVRGIDPNLNSISMNGVELGSSGDGRAVDLSAFSADVLSKIEVFKTSSADQNEGSLGGAVNLTTGRPLERSYARTTAEVQWRSTDFDGHDDYKFSFSTTQKFLDDRLGIAASFVQDNQFIRSDYYETGDYRISKFKDPVSLQTGETIAGDVWGVNPHSVSQTVNFKDRKTNTANIVLQWLPTDNSQVYLDLSHSDLKYDFEKYTFQLKNFYRGADKPVTGGAIIDEDSDTWVYSRVGKGTGFMQSRFQEEERTTFAGTFGGSLSLGAWDIDARINYTDTQQDIPVWRQVNFQGPAGGGKTPQTPPTGYSCGSEVDTTTNTPTSGGTQIGTPGQCSILFGSWFDPINHPETGPILSQVRINGREVTDKATSFFIDLDYDLDSAGFTKLEFGAKYSDRSKDRYQHDVGIKANDLVSGANKTTLADMNSPFPGSDPWLGGEAAPGAATEWIVPDFDTAFALLFPDGVPQAEENPINTWDVAEEVSSFYAKANFELLDSRLSGNFGLRYVNTSVEANGNSGFTWRDPWPNYFTLTEDMCDEVTGNVCFTINPSQGKKEYSEVLPSLNLNYSLRDDMILRFAASKTMARPSFDQLRASQNVNVSSFSETTASGGNPDLDPLVSTNFDVSWEWYFGEANLLSAAIFYKDMKDFVFTSVSGQEIINPYTGEPLRDENIDPINPPVTQVLTTSAVNGSTAEIKGLELGYQQTFDMLPGALSGLGTQLNYTYVDSEADYDSREGEVDPYDKFPLTNTSKHSYNATLFWENTAVSARLAYSWRSERLVSPARLQMSTWADDFGTLDASFQWKITDKVAITANAVNIMDEVPRTFQTVSFVTASQTGVAVEGNIFDNSGYASRTHSLNYYGRTYRVGVRVTF